MMEAINSPKEKDMNVEGPFPSHSFQPWSLWPSGLPLLGLSCKIFLKTHCLSITRPIRPWTPGQAHRGSDSQTKCPCIDQLPWQRELNHIRPWAEPSESPTGPHREEGYRLSPCLALLPATAAYLLHINTEQKRAPESSMPGFINKGAH